MKTGSSFFPQLDSKVHSTENKQVSTVHFTQSDARVAGHHTLFKHENMYCFKNPWFCWCGDNQLISRSGAHVFFSSWKMEIVISTGKILSSGSFKLSFGTQSSVFCHLPDFRIQVVLRYGRSVQDFILSVSWEMITVYPCPFDIHPAGDISFDCAQEWFLELIFFFEVVLLFWQSQHWPVVPHSNGSFVMLQSILLDQSPLWVDPWSSPEYQSIEWYQSSLLVSHLVGMDLPHLLLVYATNFVSLMRAQWTVFCQQLLWHMAAMNQLLIYNLRTRLVSWTLKRNAPNVFCQVFQRYHR